MDPNVALEKPSGNPLTPEQRKHGAWLVVMLREAMEDGSHSAWPIIAEIANRHVGLHLKRDRVCMARTILLIYSTNTDHGIELRVSDMLNMLIGVDEAFSTLTHDRAKYIVETFKDWNCLARLALACGALDLPRIDGDPKYDHVVKPAITALKNSRKKSTKKSG